MSDSNSSPWLPGQNNQGSALGDDDLDGIQPPSQKIVDIFHGRASTTEPLDIHHRIGFGPGDVADGQHTHDGTNSPALWDAATIPSSLAGSPTNAQLATAVNSLISLLGLKAG